MVEVEAGAVLALCETVKSSQLLIAESMKAIGGRMDEMGKRMEEGFAAVNQRLDTFERSVDQRFDAVDKRFDTFEKKVDQRFDSFEKNVDKRFDHVDEQVKDLSRWSVRAEERIDEYLLLTGEVQTRLKAAEA